MRLLETNEVAAVSGGWSTEPVVLAGEIAAMLHEIPAQGFLVVAAGFVGVGLGMVWNSAFESVVGQSFGSWIYDATHTYDPAKT